MAPGAPAFVRLVYWFLILLSMSLQLPSRSGAITADTWRNDNAMIAPKRHRFDALMMISLRQVSDDWILSAYSLFSGFGTTEITIPKQIKHHWDWGCTRYISRYTSSVKNWEKYFTGPTCKLLLRFRVISCVYRSSIPHKTTFLNTVLLSGFQSSSEALKSTEQGSTW